MLASGMLMLGSALLQGDSGKDIGSWLIEADASGSTLHVRSSTVGIAGGAFSLRRAGSACGFGQKPHAECG